MRQPAETRAAGPRVSTMAEHLTGSTILKIAAEIRALQAAGREICNLTVGDFSSVQFPVPDVLVRATAAALARGETNYPPSNGILELRQAVVEFYARRLGIPYDVDNVLICAGARPAIYSTFRVLVDPGDRVVFGVPSWNNPHYVHMTGAEPVAVECDASTSFLPTRSMLERHIRGARLLALNSPLNPAGTAFSADALRGICELVVEENARRGAGERPLYLMYDQVYWLLTFHGTEHVNPVTLVPDVAPYTVLIDGISKHFAATGMRVGWATGPADVIARMSDFNGHVGAWAPRAEQMATIELLADSDAIDAYHRTMIPNVQARLDALHQGIIAMKEDGLPVDAIEPMGAIYLSANFRLIGRRTPSGQQLLTNEDIRSYLLNRAGFAVVPFQAFAVPQDSGWFRLSVGAVSMEEIQAVLPRVADQLPA